MSKLQHMTKQQVHASIATWVENKMKIADKMKAKAQAIDDETGLFAVAGMKQILISLSIYLDSFVEE